MAKKTTFFDKVKELLSRGSEESLDNDTIYISVDGSVTKNGEPDAHCTVGLVIRIPGHKPITLARHCPSSSITNNDAEYDAVYMALETVFGLNYLPFPKMIITSDSKIVINQLKGEWKCNEPHLEKKRDIIRDSLASYPGEVILQWKKRCSTPDLKLANNLAQNLNQVKRIG